MRAKFEREGALFLGHDLRDGAPLHLAPKWLRTGIHVLGRTGSGKTRLLLSFVKQLIASTYAAVIVINAKGDFGRMVRDATIAAGQSRRLVFFDPSDSTHICGYNPLHSNDLDPYVQAKAARDAILAGLGQTSLEQTPQLARFLYLALTAARLSNRTMVDALDILLPDSEVRSRVLDDLRDPHLIRALSYYASFERTGKMSSPRVRSHASKRSCLTPSSDVI